MAKQITRIVLTGGPAAGKTTLISRVLKEFKQDEGWKVITIPETSTELISGFGIKPFGGCVSMLDFQDFVVADQLHKEQLALKAAQMVPEERVIVLYDRALFDNKAYVSDDEFRQVLSHFGLTEQQALTHYDTVLHLVSCAKGAEFAYNFGNEARYEPLEVAREKDELTLRAWSAHPNVHVIDNSVDFEDKIARGLRAVYAAIGRPAQQEVWHKYLIALPTLQTLEQTYHAASIDMMQTYLTRANPNVVRRVRQQKNGGDYLYFYTEKRTTDSGQWETEKPISEKEYIRYLMEGDTSLHTVHKTKYRFVYQAAGLRSTSTRSPTTVPSCAPPCRRTRPRFRPRRRSPSCARSPTIPPTKTASWPKTSACKRERELPRPERPGELFRFSGEFFSAPQGGQRWDDLLFRDTTPGRKQVWSLSCTPKACVMMSSSPRYSRCVPSSSTSVSMRIMSV